MDLYARPQAALLLNTQPAQYGYASRPRPAQTKSDFWLCCLLTLPGGF
jgi:hypothetical protein